MKELDDMAAAGQLTHLSVIPHHGGRGEPITWRASYRDSTSDGTFHAEESTPSAAIVAVLKLRKIRKPRADKKPADDFDFG